MTVRTRFAPSPTGYLHVGGARTALFSWLYAKQQGGQFVLRVEDTDRERSTEESVQAILDGMTWLGLEADEGPIFQTDRFDRYAEVIEQFLVEGHAYKCYCSRERLDAVREEQMANKQKPRYDGHCRNTEQAPADEAPYVIRFRNPADGVVAWDDAVYGRIEISNTELDDLIIARTDGTPTYNFCVVVDDLDMKITHVVRGDDHINNTPRQINMMQALEAELPVFAHLPMILGDDGKRLSKRHGAVGVMTYKDNGYLPQALLNYLVRLGWSHGDQELFSIDQMIELFSLESINRGGSVFNTEKLDWLNGQYIKALSTNELGLAFSEALQSAGVDTADGPEAGEVAELLRDRANTLVAMVDQSLFFYQPLQGYDEKAAKKNFKPAAIAPLQAVRAKLAAVSGWSAESVHRAIEQTVAELEVGFGKVALPLRIAATGGTASPALDATLAVLGQSLTLQRIDDAVAHIEALNAG
ncbi:MAG: glutamate--tRNA ligase [Granulosicoccaceae bacterium]